MISFDERASEMGLNTDLAYKGLYSYSDRLSEIVYRSLTTQFVMEDPNGEHPTDSFKTPIVSIFTKGPDDEDYKYCGYVSEIYQFIGNETLNRSIRESITSVGFPILTENPILTYDYTMMRNEFIIQNGQNHAQAGDILPVMIVNNSYNGKRAASISFGIATNYGAERLIFSFSLGELRQVHIANSTTSMSSAVNSYMTVFTESIADMINQSFSSRLTEEQMLGVLDLIERHGKKRRDAVSTLLDELQGEDTRLPSAWQMFLAIVRYSSFEPNLNVKRLMENAAESVLVIPARMVEVLEQLENM